MASTTFSGPIKAGTIANTTGTTLGDNVKNVGQVVMTQSSDVALTHATTTATALGIIIPANSQIINIDIVVEAVFTGFFYNYDCYWKRFRELQQTLQQPITFLLQQ